MGVGEAAVPAAAALVQAAGSVPGAENVGTSVLIMHQKNEKAEENSMEKGNSLSFF